MKKHRAIYFPNKRKSMRWPKEFERYERRKLFYFRETKKREIAEIDEELKIENFVFSKPTPIKKEIKEEPPNRELGFFKYWEK